MKPSGSSFAGRHVEAHAGAVFVGELACRLPQRIGRGGVPDQDRPGTEPVVGDRGVIDQLPLQHVDRLVGVLLVDVGFGRQVPDPVADATADADLDQPVDDLVEEADRAGLEERGRARLEHLDGCQLGRQPLLLGGVDRVQRAQPHEHVLLERRVVGDVPAGERLTGDVDVGVHHAGRDHEPIAADGLRRRCSRASRSVRLADVDDLVRRGSATAPWRMTSRVAFIVTTWLPTMRVSISVMRAPSGRRSGCGRRRGLAGDEALLESDRLDEAEVDEARALGSSRRTAACGEAEAVARCWPSSSCP